MDRLARKYNIFNQRFFGSSIQEDPSFLPHAFAFFLGSTGNQLATHQHLEDSEEAFRLSLQLRPERNPASIGLASLLALTGRKQEAAHQARLALTTIDELERAKDIPIPAEFERELGWDEEAAKETKSALQVIIDTAQQEEVW